MMVLQVFLKNILTYKVCFFIIININLPLLYEIEVKRLKNVKQTY
jgi:hypothetical protein